MGVEEQVGIGEQLGVGGGDIEYQILYRDRQQFNTLLDGKLSRTL